MKKRALTFILMSMMMISIIPISAEGTSAPQVESVQTGATEITINGDFNVEADNSEVAIYVFKKNKTTTDLNVGEDGISALIYHGQTTTDAEGKFEFVFEMPNGVSSDWYNAQIGGGTPFVMDVYPFYYRSMADILAASEGYVTAAEAQNYTDFTNTFNMYKMVLGIGQTIQGVNENSVCEVLYDYYLNNTMDKNDADKCIEVVQYCEVLSAVYDKKVTNLFSYSSMFGIDESRLKNFLSAPYVTQQLKENVTTKVASAKVENPAKVIDKIYEEFVLEAVREPIGYTNLNPLFMEFVTELGVEASDITDAACLKVAEESYSNWKTLGEAITAKENVPDQGFENDGGFSSFGGSISVGKSDVTIPEKLPTTVFDDLESVVWAEEAIVYLAENDVINGKGNNKFCPNDNITREEFTKILTLVFFADAEADVINFTDVPFDAWYYNPVAVAYKTGIIKGVTDTMFGTGNNITRQDAAVMACRTAEVAGLWTTEEIENTALFFDDNEIAEYAKKSVYTLYNKKVINGTGNGEVNPKSQMTRAEAAKMIYELLNV